MTTTRGRPRFQFALRRIRLVNFHNFVDETIEVRDGGHLFLLGDNGSGKTTVLDAVHYVLSGGQELELNAAARIGGRRDEGRTIQGIVLRYDAERGVVNEAGAVSYAVLELVEVASGEPLCVGLGTEATTMEARVTRWGILRRGPLEELPLVGPDRVVSARDALRARLARGDTFGRIEEYRRVIADRLFGGPAAYEEVCRFWAMAKAYREIVAGARDFGALFGRLLPVPKEHVFTDILRSLRELDGLEVSLRELEAQRSYVMGLVDLASSVERRREAIARYRWLAAFRRRAELFDVRAGETRRVAELDGSLARLAGEVQAAEARLQAAEEAVRRAESVEGAALLVELRAARARLEEAAGESAARAAEVTLRATEQGGADRDAHEARAQLVEELTRRTRRARAALDGVGGAPEELSATRALIAGMEGAGGEGPLLAVTEALAEVAAVASSCDDEAATLAGDAARTNAALDHADARLAELSSRKEEQPDVAGFASARSRLAEQGIEAHALFERLDPAPGATPAELAALELLLGDETLGALLVASDAVPRALEELRTVAPAVRVVSRTTVAAAPPPWVAALLAGTSDDEAVAVVAAALAQPAELGDVASPAGDRLELRGLAFTSARSAPRLLGAEARRAAHRVRLAAAEGARSEAALAAASVRMRREQTCAVAARWRELGDALGALGDGGLVAAYATLIRAVERARHAAERADTARNRSAEARRAVGHHEAVVRTLEARADSHGLDALEQRLDELRRDVRAMRDACRLIIGQRAVAEKDRGEALAALETLARRDADLAVEMGVAAEALRARLGTPLDDDALERYVRESKRGDQFRTIDAIGEATRGEEYAEQATCAELAGDGSRGVRCVAFAGKFGFGYERAANRIDDRRGQPAAGILAELDRTLAEQRELVTEKTRALMDTLVMGALARELQEQIERLSRMVRDINRLLEGLRFGATQYQFQVVPRPDRRDLVDLVRRISLVDEESRHRFRAWIDERLAELKGIDDDIPELLDYRRWFDYRLRMKSSTADGVELSRELRVLGSGGEQGVPNYLLVLALATLMFDTAGARLRPLLFDEAFYGIDAGRRDQLLRFATELGLQLLVASPDQDGVTPAVRYATTLFVVKDEHADVHLAPYHFWNTSSVIQPSLFDSSPTEPPGDDALCRLEAPPSR